MTELEWIVSDDTGVSSKAIWAHMMDAKVTPKPWGSYPHDPADFGRCYRLLKRFPAWRSRIGEMAQYGEEWAALAGAWDELEALFESEAREMAMDRLSWWSAPLTYNRMKLILAPAEERS